MPESREYQFAAFAVVQQYVNGFADKSRNHDVSGGTAVYRLQYELVMPKAALDFFVHDVGVRLVQPPEPRLDSITMEVDLREEIVDVFIPSGKHLVQACGLRCGVLVPPLPEVRRVRIRQDEGFRWLESPTYQDLVCLSDYECTGIVARRGGETYMAAAMGLAVVELDDSLYSNWLSKWGNILYRRIQRMDDPELVKAAKASVETTIIELLKRSKAR